MMERYPAEAAQVENETLVADMVVDAFNLLFTLKMLTPSGTLTMFRESCSAQAREWVVLSSACITNLCQSRLRWILDEHSDLYDESRHCYGSEFC